MQIRDVEIADFPRLATLNEAAIPAVNRIPIADFAWFREHAAYFRVATDPQATAGMQITGMLIALEPGTTYPSANYRWFCEKYSAFMYVDRIVVDQAVRSGGVGAALYQDLATFSQGRAPRITCEVNSRPPNPGSMRFHERLGFSQVGEQDTEGGRKTVAMLAWHFEPPAS